MECAGCDEENVVGLDRTVLRGDGGAFHDGQDVTLYAFAGNVGAVAAAASGDLVDFIEENDAVLFCAVDGFGVDSVHIDEVLFLFGLQDFAGFTHFNLAQLGLLGHDAAENIVHVHVHAGNIGLGLDFFNFNFDDFMLQLAPAQAGANVVLADGQLILFFGGELGLLGLVAQQDVNWIDGLFLLGVGHQVHQAVFHVDFGVAAHLSGMAALDQTDGSLDQIAEDVFHIAAYIADFGEFGGLNLHKGRIHQLGQAAGDFGFTNARGTDHQDVFRGHFFADFRAELGSAVAVAQGNGNGALGLVLADNKAVQLAHDLARGKFDHSITP